MPKANRIRLDNNDIVYLKVVEEMRSTIRQHNNGIRLSDYTISSVEKISNTTLNDNFNRAMVRVKKESGSDEILTLYHGTPNADTIVENGFDSTCSGDSNMFGKGIYFAALSSKSNQYAWGNNGPCPTHRTKACTQCIRQMLVCSCIMGNKFEPTQATSVIPEGYHSVYADPAKMGSSLRYPEYNILSGDQILPLYLVSYTIVP